MSQPNPKFQILSDRSDARPSNSQVRKPIVTVSHRHSLALRGRNPIAYGVSTQAATNAMYQLSRLEFTGYATDQ